MSRPSPWWPGRSGGGFGGEQSAQINVQLKPMGERKSTSDQVIARMRRKTAGMPGATLFLQNSPGRAHRRPAGQRAIPIHAPGAGLRDAGAMGARSSGRLSTLPEIADVSSDQQNSGLSSNVDHRPRYRFAPGPDGAGGRHRALRRLRPAPGLGDVQVDQPVSRGSGAAAAMVGEPGLPEHDLRPDAARHRRSAIDVHALHAGHHAHFAAAPGPVPGHHDFVQSAGRRTP